MQINDFAFSDLKIGADWKINATITEDKIVAFSNLTGDYHPLHTNKIYAQENGFDGVIAHGSLISSMCSTLVGMHLPGKKALLLDSTFKYRKPVYINDTISLHGEIVDMDSRFSIIKLKVTVTNNSNLTVCSGFFTVKVRP